MVLPKKNARILVTTSYYVVAALVIVGNAVTELFFPALSRALIIASVVLFAAGVALGVFYYIRSMPERQRRRRAELQRGFVAPEESTGHREAYGRPAARDE